MTSGAAMPRDRRSLDYVIARSEPIEIFPFTNMELLVGIRAFSYRPVEGHLDRLVWRH